MEDIRSVIARKRLRFIIKTLKNRSTTKQVVCHIWEALISLHRKTTVGTKNGFAYIDQLFDDLDRCDKTTGLPRNQFTELTKLIDRYDFAQWNQIIEEIISSLPKPSPILNDTRRSSRDISITPQIRKPMNKWQLLRISRTPIRSGSNSTRHHNSQNTNLATPAIGSNTRAHMVINASPVAFPLDAINEAANLINSESIDIH